MQAILHRLCRALHSSWQTTEQRQQALSGLPEYFRAWWAETAAYLQAAELLKDDVLVELPKDAQVDDESGLLDICLSVAMDIARRNLSTDAIPEWFLAFGRGFYQKIPWPIMLTGYW